MKWILTIFRDHDVSPVILNDLQQHSTCTVRQLLTALLRRCCVPEEQLVAQPSADLLDECLEVVLPICNPSLNVLKGPIHDLQTHLNE